MPRPPGRFSQLRWLQSTVCLCAILASLIIVGFGVLGYEGVSRIQLVVAGGFLLFASVIVMTLAPLLLKVESNVSRQVGELKDLSEAVTRQGALLASIVENTRISDAAKSLAHREQELDALRGAIREDLRGEKWEAALTLVEEMERRFGYKEEADRIREEVDDARNEVIEARLNEAIEMIEGHFQTYAWDRAQGEMDRLFNALPDHARVLALQDRMKSLREAHKSELLHQWDEAVRRSDTDQAIDILRELDQYLSAAEAHSLQASARNVFKEKLMQMGVQFRFAVMEKRWQDALTTGMDLIREYPNARMASEVRDVMDTLRERARATEESAAG